MPAISDTMLANGAAAHAAALHGETIVALSGPDIGKTYSGVVIETESDHELITDLSPDLRARRFARFVPGNAPQLGSQGRIQTEDGRTWKAVRQPGVAFLTVDYELTEVSSKDM